MQRSAFHQPGCQKVRDAVLKASMLMPRERRHPAGDFRAQHLLFTPRIVNCSAPFEAILLTQMEALFKLASTAFKHVLHTASRSGLPGPALSGGYFYLDG